MGWADCGTDSKGRPIGYAHAATCDQPGCTEQIDRGLSYACGGMHGETEHGCEGYFCPDHLTHYVHVQADRADCMVCGACATALIESGEWRDDDGDLVRVTP